MCLSRSLHGALVLRRLASDWGSLTGEARLGAQAPLPLSARLRLDSTAVDGWPLAADATLFGELRRMQAQVAGSLGALPVHADLTFAPFDLDPLPDVSVRTEGLDLHTLVDACSTQAAKLFGLFPKKGTIALGSDADLVIYDPVYRGKISQKTQQMNVDYSAFEGWEIEGRPDVVTVRGKIQVRGGKFVGQLGHGKLLARKPTHF